MTLMTSWKIDPAGVNRILAGVGTEQEGLIAALGDGEFEAIFTGISEAGGLIAKVPEALQALMQNQKSNLQAVTNRVAAGAAGVKNSVKAYALGQDDMAGEFQRQMTASASRAAYLAGFDATSNLEAAHRYGIPAAGTAAHAWTLVHVNEDGTPNEEAAFRAQVESLGVSTTLLVDTYDITKGVETAIKVAGPELGGVRIDSGDLGVLTRQVRKQLDDLGAHNTKIVVSSDLDEFAIAGLRGDPVDVFGVGTSLVTGSGAPTAGMVYKLVEVEGRPVAKRSRNKSSYGGAKRAVRTSRNTGTAVEEVVYPFANDIPTIGTLTATELTVPLMRNGSVLEGLPSLQESREYLASQLVTLPWEGLALSRDEPALATRFVGF